jgi:hypothetical protein
MLPQPAIQQSQTAHGENHQSKMFIIFDLETFGNAQKNQFRNNPVTQLRLINILKKLWSHFEPRILTAK